MNKPEYKNPIMVKLVCKAGQVQMILYLLWE